MKKLTIVLVVLFSIVGCGQEKVTLRLKYNQGDVYETQMLMKQSMDIMKMDMEMKLRMEIEAVKGETYDTKNTFEYIVSSIDQGGQKVSYNSTMKVEELSPMAKQFHNSMKPMLNTTFYLSLNQLGKTEVIKLEPDNKEVIKMKDQMGVVSYPEEAVSVGSSWENVQKNNNSEMKVTYTVTEITSDEVIANITGTLTAVPTSKVTGNITIDRKTGVPTHTVMDLEFEVMGQKMKGSSTIKVRKL